MSDELLGYIQTVRFDIEHVRPSYELTESDDPSGFEETLTVMVRGAVNLKLPGSTDFGIIHIKASRPMMSTSLRRIAEESSHGVGQLTATREGLIVQSILPFDAAWNIAAAIKAGQLGTAVVECQPIEAVGEQAFVRSVKFSPA
jgi:hypothetical protein